MRESKFTSLFSRRPMPAAADISSMSDEFALDIIGRRRFLNFGMLALDDRGENPSAAFVDRDSRSTRWTKVQLTGPHQTITP
jgi:hypothetical protein